MVIVCRWGCSRASGCQCSGGHWGSSHCRRGCSGCCQLPTLTRKGKYLTMVFPLRFAGEIPGAVCWDGRLSGFLSFTLDSTRIVGKNQASLGVCCMTVPRTVNGMLPSSNPPTNLDLGNILVWSHIITCLQSCAVPRPGSMQSGITHSSTFGRAVQWIYAQQARKICLSWCSCQGRGQLMHAACCNICSACHVLADKHLQHVVLGFVCILAWA